MAPGLRCSLAAGVEPMGNRWVLAIRPDRQRPSQPAGPATPLQRAPTRWDLRMQPALAHPPGQGDSGPLRRSRARQTLETEASTRYGAGPGPKNHVVVTGGNLNGRPVGTPANVPGAFSVGSSRRRLRGAVRQQCHGRAVLAPGLRDQRRRSRDRADSHSDRRHKCCCLVVAAGLAALRTWRPDLPPHEVERIVSESATARRGQTIQSRGGVHSRRTRRGSPSARSAATASTSTARQGRARDNLASQCD